MNRKHNPWIGLTALLLLAVVVVLVCTGCNNTKQDFNDAPKTMTVVDKTDGYIIYKHDLTGVHYFCVKGSYGRSACVMVNADGTPYIVEKE